MKVTKYLHSCLLINGQGKTVLIDPGSYTFDEKVFDMNKLNALDAIAITHEHQDHMSIPFIKLILEKFPKTQIISNSSIKEILTKEGIEVNTKGNNFIRLTPVPHEKIFMGEVPQNVMVTVFNRLSHPGDSLSFEIPRYARDDEGRAEILALPVQAPWGSTTWAVEKATEVKPKAVIPIHDYHWKDSARKLFYQWLEGYFKQIDIDFKKVETGETIEV